MQTTTAEQSTELATVETQPNGQEVARPAPAKAPLTSGGKIAAIVPQDFDQAFRLARAIYASGMAPKSLDTVEKVTVAILHGMEVGLTPMAALQSIAVVNGMPTIWGDGMLALIRNSGLLEAIEESVEDDKDGPTVAVCKVKRKGSGWTIQQFTRPEAVRAGLWKKQGPWTQYPRRMMQMRARAWACRDAFPDVLRGLAFTEEVQDITDVTGQGSATTTAPEPRRSQFTDVSSSAASPAGEQDDGQAASSPAAAGGDRKSDNQAPDQSEATSQPATSWAMPDDIIGQDKRMQFVRTQFMDQAETVAEIDAIVAEHAEFIAKLGSKKANFEKEIADRRLTLGGAQ